MTQPHPHLGALSRPEFVALIAAIMSLNALAIDVMLPALPHMAEALGIANANDRQYVVSVYMLGFGVGQLLVGPLSDRFGRRMPLLLGIGLYIAAALAAAAAPSFGMLLAMRLVQGLGAASTRVIAVAVVRDRFSGSAMAEVMSLAFMVFMVIPVVAPSIGEVLLAFAPWQSIFLFMGVLALAFGGWAFLRLPETLAPAQRRPLTAASIFGGFRIVVSNRAAFWYAMAGTCTFGALFGFISTAQQIYVDIYGLGVWFPAAFAFVAGLMAVSSFLNSRIVRRWGMRNISHLAILAFTGLSGLLLLASVALDGHPPLWLFLGLLSGVMFMFGWAASNMNSLSLQPLGAVAGTASSVFGFIQTLGGALMGGFVGQQFDGTVIPTAAGYFVLGALAVVCVLIAERGRMFAAAEDAALA
ncbi:multidrug effflux MFS transporter [Rubellimicrobium aerolatum]|uniref:Bcr/CflA family efflux transporter n=1 Tax=Rubellimicrobium aerolatum TaxID=490979 RepID=A0ABW0SDV1_9RHOB|nr:multidrug effflux MFS transporter [Rubellimicrobium aerolatum]MBP1805793.1 DHA1 family bicyclomycin/chloramphenicol resistance-like MFS transporter [Rubellimicrobium aerolatum]